MVKTEQDDQGLHIHFDPDSAIAAMLLNALYSRQLLARQRGEPLNDDAAVRRVLEDYAVLLDAVATIPRKGIPIPGVAAPPEQGPKLVTDA